MNQSKKPMKRNNRKWAILHLNNVGRIKEVEKGQHSTLCGIFDYVKRRGYRREGKKKISIFLKNPDNSLLSSLKLSQLHP